MADIENNKDDKGSNAGLFILGAVSSVASYGIARAHYESELAKRDEILASKTQAIEQSTVALQTCMATNLRAPKARKPVGTLLRAMSPATADQPSVKLNAAVYCGSSSPVDGSNANRYFPVPGTKHVIIAMGGPGLPHFVGQT